MKQLRVEAKSDVLGPRLMVCTLFWFSFCPMCFSWSVLFGITRLTFPQRELPAVVAGLAALTQPQLEAFQVLPPPPF